MRRTRAILIAAGLGVAMAAGPARAVQQIGHQTVADFEEFAVGTNDIHYVGLDTFILGGTVEDGAVAGFASHSGQQVYVGTSITSQQTNGDLNFLGVDLWPALGAFVSPGDAPVTATFYGYDPATQALVVQGSVQTVGSGANQFLSWVDAAGGSDLIDVTFSSSATFAIDDLRLGLPNVIPGIPEPATWAVMLLGFAGVGMVLRGRRPVRGETVVG